MSLKEFRNWVVKNEGVIISDGTLNLEHLLPKVFDLLVTFRLNESLQQEILSVFEWDDEEDKDDVYIVGLFEKQYYDEARIDDDFLEDANYIWNEDVFNFLSEIAPEGYYFGSNEGDGACIGLFKDEEQWAECIECGSEQLITDEDIREGDCICEECEKGAIAMTLTNREEGLIKDNLRAYLTHFVDIRIEREDYGKGFYVFQENEDSYIQYCYDIHYLNGWLYGAVQSKCKIIKTK